MEERNFFKVMAEEYRQKEGNHQKKIRVYDFLSECDQDDFTTIFRATSGMPHLLLHYLDEAMDEAEISEENQNKIIENLFRLLEEK